VVPTDAGLRMRASRRLPNLALLALLAAVLASCGGGGPRAPVGRGGPSWPSPDADAHNTRRVGGPIDATTVAKLGVAWRFPLSTAYTATAAIAGGVVYAQDGNSDVFAIELREGKLIWKTRLGVVDQGPNGVTLADGRVYGATSTGAFALDQATGKQLWSSGSLIQHQYEGIDMAPGEHDGLVYVSTVPGTGGDIGTLWALDGVTGKPRWKWEEVPASLWGQPEVNGGGGLWHPPAFDERGGLYISVANPVPWPGTDEAPWGRSHPGPNRWNNSLVKLDARTGRFLWGTQVGPHDVYDWDLQLPPILARAGHRQIVLDAGKMGFAFAFDAGTGRLLWKRSLGIHNGHDDDSVRAMHGEYRQFRYGQRIYPGDWGGVQTQAASNGRTLFLGVNNLYAVYHEQALPKQQDTMKGTGELVALDVATGRVRWDRRLPHTIFGGASIANDVVFTTTYEGTVRAFSTRTGKPLWKAPLPAATDAPVAIAGDTVIAGSGITLTDSQRRQLVAFRLGAR
jgi:outer membrane protein assembly factor BamB